MPVVVPYNCRTIQSCVRGGRRIVEDMCQWCDCNFGRQTFAANGSSSEAVAMLHRAPPQWRGVSSLYSAMSTCWLTAEGRTNRRCPGDAVVCEQNTKSPACTTPRSAFWKYVPLHSHTLSCKGTRCKFGTVFNENHHRRSRIQPQTNPKATNLIFHIPWPVRASSRSVRVPRCQ